MNNQKKLLIAIITTIIIGIGTVAYLNEDVEPEQNYIYQFKMYDEGKTIYCDEVTYAWNRVTCRYGQTEVVYSGKYLVVPVAIEVSEQSLDLGSL